ncbi:thioesterase family protein [Mycolicibacterium vaccae]|uniref:thioesterase family protein n=1 Tax=Mycolicibacterium vaccae TaxID=1810 RepID=UPI003D087054
MAAPVLTPFFVPHADGFVPNSVAQGGWGPTLGGQVVGGLLARSVEQHLDDPDLHPARFTVEILRRVATEPVQVAAHVTRSGRRMRAVDATMTQHGELVARASALCLRRGEQPEGRFFTTPVDMPPPPEDPAEFDGDIPMFIIPHGGELAEPGEFPWQHDGPRYAWLREIRDLVDGEELTPFVRATMAVDVTSSLTNFGTAGLSFINADFTLALSRLPRGPYIGLAALTHYSADGVATGSTTLFDADGPIGTGLSTAIANLHFDPDGSRRRVEAESSVGAERVGA